MKEQVTIEVITHKEREQIAGRFALVGKGENVRIIGTIGSLFPHDLNRRQKNFLASWYFLEQDGNYSFEVLDSYQECTLPHRNFNGFLRITKL